MLGFFQLLIHQGRIVSNWNRRHKQKVIKLNMASH